MDYIGISCGFHDASIAVVSGAGKLEFFSRSSEYSGIGGDSQLNVDIIADAKKHLGERYEIHYYEKPLLKYLRQLRSGEPTHYKNISAAHMIGAEYHKLLGGGKIHTHLHHKTHAAYGFQTSDYERATVVVIDAIGEFDTASIWAAEYRDGRATYRRLWRQTYPDSIGLFYSAMTGAIGMTPVRDEYHLMKLSETGNRASGCVPLLLEQIHDVDGMTFKNNLHCGLDLNTTTELLQYSDSDIAAATQMITEKLIWAVMRRASDFGWSKNLVYSGGVALNSVANKNLNQYFDTVTIPKYCGDAGSSIGACALAYGKKLIK